MPLLVLLAFFVVVVVARIGIAHRASIALSWTHGTVLFRVARVCGIVFGVTQVLTRLCCLYQTNGDNVLLCDVRCAYSLVHIDKLTFHYNSIYWWMTECLSCLCLCVRMFLSGSLAKMDFFFYSTIAHFTWQRMAWSGNVLDELRCRRGKAQLCTIADLHK